MSHQDDLIDAHDLELAAATTPADRSAATAGRTMEMLEEVSRRLQGQLALLKAGTLPPKTWVDSAKWLTNQILKFETLRLRHIQVEQGRKPEGGNGTPEDDFRMLLDMLRELGPEQLAQVQAVIAQRERTAGQAEIATLPRALRTRSRTRKR